MAGAVSLTDDYFALLQLPRTQALDNAQLDARYRELQARVHPDKHAHASPADQRLAMQWATQVNEAYQTLKAPLARARYLLGLLGHDVAIESNTAMPAEFLIAQMELREAVEDAKVGAGETATGAAIEQLEALENELRAKVRAEFKRLETLIDNDRNYVEAAQLVRQLMFEEKLLAEIADALDTASA